MGFRLPDATTSAAAAEQRHCIIKPGQKQHGRVNSGTALASGRTLLPLGTPSSGEGLER
ncbi:hypothetical protein PC120_g22186 [Phytophthora cactorum]|nr:hypothetical protein PC120_g22186 [Phytophthora cactorum]